MVVIIDDSAFVQNYFNLPPCRPVHIPSNTNPTGHKFPDLNPKPARLSAVLKEIVLQKIA